MKIVQLMLKTLREESSFDEWFIRKSIDTSLRYIAIVMVIFVIIVSNIMYFILGTIAQSETIINDNGCKTVLYVLISMLVGQIYFGFVYYKNVCSISNKMSINIFEPILSICETDHKDCRIFLCTWFRFINSKRRDNLSVVHKLVAGKITLSPPGS